LLEPPQGWGEAVGAGPPHGWGDTEGAGAPQGSAKTKIYVITALIF